MKTSKGFTLIELLVVIAIIGILAGIVLVSLSGARDRAKDARIIADMNQVRSAAQIWESNKGTYSGFDTTTSGVDLAASDAALEADVAAQGGTYNIYVSGTGDAYCAEGTLISLKVFCVDSTLRAKQYDVNPATCALASFTCE